MRKILLFLLCILQPFFLFASETRITIIGDSLTEGYGIPKKKAYPAILEKKLQLRGYKLSIVNAGSSGSTSASALKRMKWHLRGKPNIVVLVLGANDGLRGISTEKTKQNLKQAILFAQNQKVTVVLIGMKLPYNYGEKYRKDFERIFTDLSKIPNIKYTPFLLKDVGAIPSMNLPDGIHPNEKGHQQIAKNLMPFFRQFLSK